MLRQYVQVGRSRDGHVVNGDDREEARDLGCTRRDPKEGAGRTTWGRSPSRSCSDRPPAPPRPPPTYETSGGAGGLDAGVPGAPREAWLPHSRHVRSCSALRSTRSVLLSWMAIAAPIANPACDEATETTPARWLAGSTTFAQTLRRHGSGPFSRFTPAAQDGSRPRANLSASAPLRPEHASTLLWASLAQSKRCCG